MADLLSRESFRKIVPVRIVPSSSLLTDCQNCPKVQAMWLCLDCGKETEPDEKLMCCPHCQGTGIPVDLDKMLTVRTTWHELRILTMWAEFWASNQQDKANSEKMLRVVYRIADRIQQQHMDQEGGLTFASELADLRAHPQVTGDVEQNVIRELPPEKLY